MILARLSKGVILDHVAEVPLPVRFLFICVGPALESVEYLEIGRSLATLMSNKVRHMYCDLSVISTKYRVVFTLNMGDPAHHNHNVAN